MHENETEKLPKIQADEGDLNYLMTFPNLAGRKGGVQKNPSTSATIYHASQSD